MVGIESILAHPLTERLGWTLVHSLWQGAVAAGLLALALRRLRTASANLRYLAGYCTLLCMAAMPVITFTSMEAAHCVRGSYGAVVSATPTDATSPGSAHRSANDLSTSAPLSAAYKSNDTHPSEPRWQEQVHIALNLAIPWVVVAWAGGVCIMAIRLLGGWVQVQRMRRRGVEPVGQAWEHIAHGLCERLRVRQRVRIFSTRVWGGPIAIGWIRPVVIMPISVLTGLPAESVQALLAHELAHIRRYDYLANLVQTVIETLLFYHPAVWWVARQVRQEREHCCDDLAVAATGNAARYVRALAALEELRRRRPLTACAAPGGGEAVPFSGEAARGEDRLLRARLGGHDARPAGRPAAMAATGGSLAVRVRRLLLGVEADPANPRALAATLCMGLLAGLLLWPIASVARVASQGPVGVAGEASAEQAGPEVLADSVADFAGPGRDLPNARGRWSYGAAENLSFEPLAVWRQDRWQSEPEDQAAVQLSARTARPVMRHDGVSRAAVRRWVSPAEEQLEIVGQIGREVPASDEITCQLWVWGHLFWSRRIPAGQAGLETYRLRLHVLEGASLDFLVETESAGEAVPVVYTARIQRAVNISRRVLADSFSEYSAEQGRHGWYYGYYATPGEAASFSELPNFEPVRKHWGFVKRRPPWALLWSAGGHPGGINHGAETWVVRRWVSPVEGRLTVFGMLSRGDIRPGHDGVEGQILIDGRPAWSHQLPGHGGGDTNYLLEAEVRVGTTIDFAIAPRGDDDNDTTTFTATILQNAAMATAELSSARTEQR